VSLPLLPALLHPLAALFVKAGVGIGGLSDAQRRLVFGLVWAGLPGTPMSERDVNEALKARISGAVSFLDTDHVELRRWLVDTGWVVRDGYGRKYQRVAVAALPTTLQPLGSALEGVDTDMIAAATRATYSAEREARQRAWKERNGEPS
jgi:hypothetical protein